MKKLLIANWKMNKKLSESVDFAKKIKNKKFIKVQTVIAPNFVALQKVGGVLKGSNHKLCSQDVAAWPAGSFTGEVSIEMVKEVGCQYSIVGHSERRQKLNETDELINEKIKMCLAKKIVPIVCLGETLQEKNSGKTTVVVVQQLKQAFAKIENLCKSKVIIAYEPVWAIGSGQVVAVEDLEEVYHVVKRGLSMFCSSDYFDKNVSFIYGGSVDEKNIKDFVNLEFLAGFLVGSASLQEDRYLKLAELIQNN